jgi:hypothetical protein
MSKKTKYIVIGLAIAVLLSVALLSTPAFAESTYSLLRETLSKVTDIKTTLSSGGTVYEMINTIKGWVATILTDVGTIKSIVTTNLDAKISNVLSGISGLDTKLGAFTAPDTVASLLYGIKAKTDTIAWGDVTAIKGLFKSDSGTVAAGETVTVQADVGAGKAVLATVRIVVTTTLGPGEKIVIRTTDGDGTTRTVAETAEGADAGTVLEKTFVGRAIIIVGPATTGAGAYAVYWQLTP